LLKLDAALGKRHQEEVASNVGTEDGEQLRARELTVADDLDGVGGLDEEARIVAEEAAGGEDRGSGCSGYGEDGDDEEGFAPAGFGPGGKEAAANGNAAAGAEERLSVGFSIGSRGAVRTWSARVVAPRVNIPRLGVSGGGRRIVVCRRLLQNGRASIVCVAFRHA
jgi:hypothetical protein